MNSYINIKKIQGKLITNKYKILKSLVTLLTAFSWFFSVMVSAYSNILLSSPLIGEVTQKKPKQVHLACDIGDYITGHIINKSGKITVDSVTPSGNIERRLVNNKAGTHNFYLVTKYCDEVWNISGVGDYNIVLEHQIKVSQQNTGSDNKQFISPAITKLYTTLKNKGSTDGFWLKVKENGTPLIEETAIGTVMTFLVRGNYTNVKIIGAPSNDHESLMQLESSDTWYKSFIVPSDTRLSYQIAPNIPQPPFTGFAKRVAIKAVAQVDPNNHSPWPTSAIDKYTQKSTISLKDTPQTSYLATRSETPNHHVERFNFTSEVLGNTREIIVYKSSASIKLSHNPIVLYVFDADAYFNLANLPNTLNNLTATNKLPPIIAVFISNPSRQSRATELPANSIFADVMAGELVPQINKRLNIKVPSKRTVIAGSSYGGLASTTVALNHPEKFGNVISLSGSYWWKPKSMQNSAENYVVNQVIAKPKKDINFFLSAGAFETSRGVGDGILETNRQLRDVLKAKGYTTHYKEYSAGHDYFAWQSIIAEGLLTLFPTPSELN